MSDVQKQPSNSDPPHWAAATVNGLRYILGWMGNLTVSVFNRSGELARKGWEAIKESPFIKSKSEAHLIKAKADAEALLIEAKAKARVWEIDAETRSRTASLAAEGDFAVRIAQAEEIEANAAFRQAQARQLGAATEIGHQLAHSVIEQDMPGSICFNDTNYQVKIGGSVPKMKPAVNWKKESPPSLIQLPELPKLNESINQGSVENA